MSNLRPEVQTPASSTTAMAAGTAGAPPGPGAEQPPPGRPPTLAADGPFQATPPLPGPGPGPGPGLEAELAARSPEDVRSMLNSYQAGLERGRRAAATTKAAARNGAPPGTGTGPRGDGNGHAGPQP
jgi:hypothetical protein